MLSRYIRVMLAVLLTIVNIWLIIASTKFVKLVMEYRTIKIL